MNGSPGYPGGPSVGGSSFHRTSYLRVSPSTSRSSRSNPLVIDHAHGFPLARPDGRECRDHPMDCRRLQGSRSASGTTAACPVAWSPNAVAAQVTQGWFTAFPDMSVKQMNRVVSDDAVAAEVQFTGTNTGPVMMAGKEIPPTGRGVVGKGTYFVRVKNGKVVEFNSYPRHRGHDDVVGVHASDVEGFTRTLGGSGRHRQERRGASELDLLPCQARPLGPPRRGTEWAVQLPTRWAVRNQNPGTCQHRSCPQSPTVDRDSLRGAVKPRPTRPIGGCLRRRSEKRP